MKTLFRKHFLILSFSTIFITKGIFAQNSIGNINNDSVIKTKYTILDSDSRSFRSFFEAKSGNINFDLIELENLNNNSKILGVEIKLKTDEVEKSSSSMAFANIGSFWGVTSNVTYKNIQNKGYVFLDKNDMETIINFLNEIIGATGQAQDKFIIYKIAIRKQFELGMVFDPKSNEINKWGFIFTTNESTYRLNYSDGIAILRSLSKFYKYIKENQQE